MIVYIKVLKSFTSNERSEGVRIVGVQIRVMIVGLGAGLLPMFVHNHIPADNILVCVHGISRVGITRSRIVHFSF